MPRRTPIRPEDIYEVRSPSACRLSPSGDRLVTAVSRADREQLKNVSHLWMIDLAGRETPDRAVRQFTHGKHSDRNPRWSPDGRTVAFTSGRSEKSELWTIPVDGGEACQLTTLGGNVGDFAWSPDGKRLVIQFTPQDAEAKEREARKKRGEPGAEAPRVRVIDRIHFKLDGAGFLPQGRTHLWMVDAATGKARQLTSDDRYDEYEPRFSPDGRWIYFVSNRSADPDLMFQRSDIWRMPARGGSIEQVRNFDGPSSDFSLSPDGRWLAYLGQPDPNAPWHLHHTKLYVTPSAGGRPICLTETLDREIGNSTISDTAGLAGSAPPLWSPDSREVYFTVTNAGNTEIWRANLRDRRPEPVVNEPGMVIDFAIDFAGGWIHTTWNDLANPGEIRSFPLPAPVAAVRARRAARAATAAGAKSPSLATPRTHTAFNSEWLRAREVAQPEELWFHGRGNHPLQGWILQPRRLNRARKYPGLLYIHGGPATQYGRAFFHEFQVLAAAGYVVFYCNPRGGTGYSARHMSAILNRWGTVDYDDLMAFTDVVVRRTRHLDRRRMGVAGGSYGGYMTNWIIGHTRRFACAVTSRSISNFMSFIGSSDFGYAWPVEFGGIGPWDNPKHYLRMSPLSYLKNMKTPTLIEHQEEDHRCPIEQAEQLWAGLKARGVPVEFIRYPGEPHGMSRGGRPDRRIDRLERILRWLDQWTKGKK